MYPSKTDPFSTIFVNTCMKLKMKENRNAFVKDFLRLILPATKKAISCPTS